MWAQHEEFLSASGYKSVRLGKILNFAKIRKEMEYWLEFPPVTIIFIFLF